MDSPDHQIPVGGGGAGQKYDLKHHLDKNATYEMYIPEAYLWGGGRIMRTCYDKQLTMILYNIFEMLKNCYVNVC